MEIVIFAIFATIIGYLVGKPSEPSWAKKFGYASIEPVEYEVIGNIYENPELLEG